LVSFFVLMVAIAFIIWRYGIRRGRPEKDAGAVFSPPGFRDNLTLIDGIGATLESRLNDLGITSFKQIAEFDEKDIERVNEKLSFKGRIQREEWIAQARKLVEAGTRPDKPGPAAPRGKKKAARGPGGQTVTKRKARRKTAGMKGAAGKPNKKTKKKTAGKTTKKSRKKS
jgi:hypothetical protein